jgi:hypothetical protein
VYVYYVGNGYSCRRRSKIYLHHDKGTQRFATYVSLTVKKKPSEWPTTEQMDMGSCAIFAKLIVVKLPGPIPRDECICCLPNAGSHWSSIEDGRLASARCLGRVVCRHVEGL